MAYKTLHSLFNSKQYSLPFWEHDDSKSYLHHYKAQMQAYLKDIATFPVTSFNGKGSGFVSDLNDVIMGIDEVLNLYLNGFPGIAYEKLKLLIDQCDLTAELNLRVLVLGKDTPLYRIKIEHDDKKFKTVANGINLKLNPKELFHIPFQKRKFVGTNRFSIPGYPSLYLSESLYTSWSECALKKTMSFHAGSFKNHRPLYIMDLVPLNQIIKHNKGKLPPHLYSTKSHEELYSESALIYPLLFACHSKIKYNPAKVGAKFKSEYIIPQLLLQWYREKKIMVDGMRYLSCTAEQAFPKKNFSKFNYVLPALKICEHGYCEKLMAVFSACAPYTFSNPSSLSVDKLIDKISTTLDSQVHSPLR